MLRPFQDEHRALSQGQLASEEEPDGPCAGNDDLVSSASFHGLLPMHIAPENVVYTKNQSSVRGTPLAATELMSWF
jgi:hypothetical protein